MDLVQQGRPCRWWMDWVHVCLFVVVRLVCDLVDSTGSAGDRHPRRWRSFIQPGGRVRASAGHGHWRGAGRLGRWRFRWLQLTYWQFINVVSLSLLQLFLDSTRWWIRTSTTPRSSTRAKWVSAGMAWPKHRSQRLFLSSRQTPPTRNSRFSKSTTTIAKRSNSVSTTSLWQTTSSTGETQKKTNINFFLKSIPDRLFKALEINTRLEVLSLSNTGLTDRTAETLAEALEKNATLRVIK